MTREKTKHFWETKKPNMTSMLLNEGLSKIHIKERDEVISYLPDINSLNVLELACGIGRFTSYFAKYASHVTAVDFIEKFIKENQRRNKNHKNITYICSDVMDLSFNNHEYDFIFLNWILMYLEDKDLDILLNRLFHALKHKGYIFIRESCSWQNEKRDDHYYANYRAFYLYENIIKESLKLRKSGYIKFYLDQKNDPFQCYWLFQKEG